MTEKFEFQSNDLGVSFGVLKLRAQSDKRAYVDFSRLTIIGLWQWACKSDQTNKQRVCTLHSPSLTCEAMDTYWDSKKKKNIERLLKWRPKNVNERENELGIPTSAKFMLDVTLNLEGQLLLPLCRYLVVFPRGPLSVMDLPLVQNTHTRSRLFFFV